MFKVALSRANVAGPPNKTKQSRVDSDAAQILASSPKDVLNSTARLKCVLVVTFAAVSSIDRCEDVSEVEVCARCDLCSSEQY